MRTFITLSFFIFILNIFSQDTIKDDLNILIYKQGRLCQKEFRSSENHIKIVYLGKFRQRYQFHVYKSSI